MNSYIILEDGIGGLINFEPISVSNTHPNYAAILLALKEERWDEVKSLINIAHQLKSYVGTGVQVDADAGVVAYNGEELHGTIVNRILTMLEQGFKIDPLVKFLENLMQNPSKRAVDELYGFLEYGKMPITEDGCFLAYKRVRSDYKSVHDGKTDNSIGTVVEMPRNKVDDRSEHTCSYGLHFCSHEYLKSFSGDKVVVLKINPADVVSIPTDYNNTKGRACRYEVVGELSAEEVDRALSNNIWSDRAVVNDYDDRDDWEDDYFDDEDDEDEEDDEDFRADIADEDGEMYIIGSDSVGRSPQWVGGYRAGQFDARFEQEDTDPVGTWEYICGYRKGVEDEQNGRDSLY